ncbi:MAG: D-alanyl-D-alanine carboxypeptidase/D-alanyl-D-alanine-endopeptidase [Deltaproteobacteria bacterium]|nr:D-alanyl-D-alanine carboxypeptidase/D-alanyl-D-alanine-endopeptidase [Deltaproteobacteria bacterium]
MTVSRRPRQRGPLTLLLAAAAVVAIAGVDQAPASARSPASAVAPLAATTTATAQSPEATPSQAEGLVPFIDAALDKRFLADAAVGVSVVDLETGKVLYQRGDTTPLNPASNVKLVTTASALGILGPSHTYTTGLYRKDGALSGSTIKGSLYLRGSGDPALVTANLYELVGKLQGQGITKITGGIVVDASAFDRDELPPGFDQKNEVASYRAPSGATVVNFNTFEVHVRPSDTVGTAPFAGVVPPVGHIALRLEAKTEAGGKRRLFADLDHGEDGTDLRLHGTLGADSSATSFRYPVANPSRYAGELLALMLKQHGIRRGSKRIKMGRVPSKARLLAAHRSAPLGVLIRSVNKFSNNFMAEQILKTIDVDSSPATFDGALRRVREHLVARGVPAEGLSLGNGSGLYDTNRISPAQLTAVLAMVYADLRIRPDFMASLAIMGIDGTTRSRLRDTDEAGWIRVKTGTLDGVSALSGYAGAPGRKPIVFSILFNGLRRSDTSQARRVQDSIARALAQHAAGKAPTEPED